MHHRRFHSWFLGTLLVLLSVQPLMAQGDDSNIYLPAVRQDVRFQVEIEEIILNPDAVFVGEAQQVEVYALIPYETALEAPRVALLQTDADGQILEELGVLVDDGDLGKGDEIAGDGLFSLVQEHNFDSEQRIYLQIRAERDRAEEVLSEVFALDIYARIDAADYQRILDTQENAVEHYFALLDEDGHEEAQAAVVAELEADPGVAEVGVAESGLGVWLLYQEGILGILELNPEETRAAPARFSEPPAEAAGTAPDEITADETVVTEALPPVAPVYRRSDPFAVHSAAATDDANRIRNRNAIVLAPFLFDFGATDDAPRIHTILEDSLCPDYSVTYLTNTAVTVDVYRTLHQYGTIAITSHGDSYFQNLDSDLPGVWGWNNPADAQVVFLTGQRSTQANRETYEADLRQGRLALSGNALGGYYAVLPSFVTHYAATRYPNSLVYIGACRTTYNNSMADAFIGSGAQTYLGYSEYVLSSFAGDQGEAFFRRFVEDPDFVTTGDAFTPGLNDGQAVAPAFFQMIGADDLRPPVVGLENGTFEDGTLGAWQRAGDGRVISQLGQFSPVEGNWMGIISTGLGFTIDSGSIEQNVCLEPGTESLAYSWNFSSEEFIEYCTTRFQDFFEVEIETEDGGTNQLFRINVDDLCAEVAPTNLAFDQGGPGCEPSEGVGFGTEGNDCKVWSTGWRFNIHDIREIAEASENKPVTLRFSAGDVGDSIFDTAILLDQIQIVVDE